jgi:two-component system, NtrC family, sensor kinase
MGLLEGGTMKLTLKLVLVFMLGNIVLAAIYGYLAVEREVRLFEQATCEQAQQLAGAMEKLLVEAFRQTGHQGVLQVVQSATGKDHPIRIRWVWFNAQPGSEFSPAAPSERLTPTAIQQHLVVAAIDSDGTAYAHVYWPVALDAARQGGLEFSEPMGRLEANKRDVIRRTALLIAGMVLLSGLLAAFVGVRFVGGPLRRLIEKTRRVASGHFDGPVHLHSHDELAELADSLNAMCIQLGDSQRKIREETAARIAAMEQLRHADRLKTLGRLAAGIAHELGTPLNVVSGRAGLIVSGKLRPEEVGPSATAIKAEADKMTKIIRQLLDFARASTPHKTAVDLRQVVSQTVDLLRPLAQKQHVELRFAHSDASAVAQIDAGQMQQVLTNLVINAVQAMSHGGEVEIAIRRQTARSPDDTGAREDAYFGIEIRDQGVGISEEHLQHLFEPFFTTKGVGEGTGLGLSIAYGIVREHGGWIDVKSRPHEGSCFTVFLPEGEKL